MVFSPRDELDLQKHAVEGATKEFSLSATFSKSCGTPPEHDVFVSAFVPRGVFSKGVSAGLHGLRLWKI